ncbi:MAG TPA: zinc ribbon domain-containing protein [Ktedonobacteraceae bacterium]|nr:zinc ribbon domain-containing protein [Ktedonobacteraceae bacterium]
MTQVLPRNCPRCGVPTVPGHRFCANCGLSNEAMQATSQYQQPPQAKATRDFSQKRAPENRPRRIAILLIALSLILFVAAILVIVLPSGLHLPRLGGSASQPPITTMPINATVTYAGVEVTVVNAQQSQSFLDDPKTSTDGMVRLDLQEQNKTSVTVSWSYYTIAHLLLPGKGSIGPGYVKEQPGIAPGATQSAVLDFAVPISDKIRQLTLQLGAANEAQVGIPLTGKADLSKYAPKTTKLNGQMVYFGLNYTLTSATSSLSISGQQASKGKRYLTLALSVDNTLSQEAIAGSPYDYIRLQSGNTTFSPIASTLPVSFATGESGKAGTVTFLVPQNSTNFTLILLAQAQNPGDQASTDFQIAK